MLAGRSAADPDVFNTVIAGRNNHDRRTTAPVVKKAPEDCGRFTVDVSSMLKSNGKPAQGEETVPLPPELGKYDVLGRDCHVTTRPARFNKLLEEKLKAAKIALVVMHAANKAFSNRDEYNLMIGHGLTRGERRRTPETRRRRQSRAGRQR